MFQKSQKKYCFNFSTPDVSFIITYDYLKKKLKIIHLFVTLNPVKHSFNYKKKIVWTDKNSTYELIQNIFVPHLINESKTKVTKATLGNERFFRRFVCLPA